MGPHISDRRHAAEHAIQLSSILAQIRQRASRNTSAAHDDGSSATAKQYDCIGNDDAAATCSRDRNACSLTRLNRDVEHLYTRLDCVACDAQGKLVFPDLGARLHAARSVPALLLEFATLIAYRGLCGGRQHGSADSNPYRCGQRRRWQDDGCQNVTRLFQRS
jgi:hypothetical protein